MEDGHSRAGDMLVVCEGVTRARIPVADSFVSRFWGLMRTDSLGGEDGLLLLDCSRVHCCFMKYPIDVLYLDADLRGIEVEALAPWRFGRKVKGARHVLEMRAGFFDGMKPSSIRVI